MKSGLSVLGAAALLFALSLPGEGQNAPPIDRERFKRSVDTQKRINHYFHDVVVPKLKPCWDRLKGKGTIEVKYRFAKNAKGAWAFSALKGGKSSLTAEEQKPALACMTKAVTATSFAAEKGDVGKSYLLAWDWPVPLPPDASRQAEAMFRAVGGTEGTGCDGHGSQARCVTCSGSPLTCIYVCVGSDSCEVGATHPGGFDSICTEGGRCASGGPFGVLGGAVMY